MFNKWVNDRAPRSRHCCLQLVLLAVLAVHSPGVAQAQPATPSGLAGASGFAARLYKQLRGVRGNLFFSPASIRMAMALSYAGAAGQTATQLRLGLGLADGDAAHAAMEATRKRLRALDSPPSLTLNIVNRLWARRGLQLRPAFLAIAGERYGAPLGEVDFAHDPERSRRAINEWVSEQTAHLIPELLPRDTIDAQTQLVLVNAVYFKARWVAPFRPADTEPASFLGAGRAVQAQLMRKTIEANYAEVEGGQLLELSYAGYELVMDVLLPARADGLAALEQRLVDGALPGWLAHLEIANVDVALPRLHSSSRLNLNATLAAMGMTLPFDQQRADFSGITGARGFYLSEVVHQAVVTVDEQGTEAAAATGKTYRVIEKRPHVIFRADHPFIYLIRERGSDEILFLGRLVDPTTQ